MIFALVTPLILGWLCGWLVNYLADTLPRTRRLSHPACALCEHPYPWLTYLAFGACPDCGHRRGFRPWLVQVAMLSVSLYTWLKPSGMGYWLGILLLTYFLLVLIIDLEHRLILHPTSIVGAFIALGIGLWLHGWKVTLLGGLGGFGIMFGLYYLGVLFSRWRARRMRARGLPADEEEALGQGDVILAGILGLVLGWPLIWFGLLLGILLGGVVGILLLLS
ncbi:MAG TPA: prepilin peptidase, partial [Anaerolineales bacterium]|nr:prepilin peptidase [Anaerolineales bacterium]